MRFTGFLILLLISFTLFARTNEDNLTHDFAKIRKQQIKKVDYNLAFEFQKGSGTFRGNSVINIELNHLQKDVSIDSMVKINSLKVNDRVITDYPSRTGSFDIPKTLLTKKLKVEVEYTGDFSKETNGFKKMKDAIDGEEYMYTDLEPYYAHRVFPSFDQPDIKATYVVTAKTPVDWNAISNEVIESKKTEKDFNTFTFRKTPLFSSYLFFLAIGPYMEWREEYNKLPIHIHARRSMTKFMDPERIFATIRAGIKFFNEYFDFPYPYTKYGLVFVPDLAVNALENPGAISFHEQFIFMGSVPPAWMGMRENLILHETAHMWFGDLVTMKWWDDLWLKEGFATYVATIAQEREIKSTYAPLDFLSQKSWGYWQDQLITTHPIESKVSDVRSSKGIFDGITYAKGASAIKQLHYFVGEDGFREGLRSYFKTHALSNADRQNFFDAISKASKKNLDSWAQRWIKTAGPNRVKINFDCTSGNITEATLLQEPSSSGTLSPHRVKLGLFEKSGDALNPLVSIDVVYDKEKTELKELIGGKCPDFILPNIEDKDYALFSLDKVSLKNATLALQKLPDTLSRYNLWLILMQMVRDQEISAPAFMDMAMEAFKVEQDDSLIGLIFARLTVLRNFRQVYFSYLSPEERAKIAPQFEKILWDRVLAAPPGSGIQILFYDFYVGLAQSKESLENIYSMYKKNEVPKGLKLDIERKWRFVRTLAVNNHPEAKALIEKESKDNPSIIGKRMAIAGRAAIPELEIKRETFRKLMERKEFDHGDFREAASFFVNHVHPEANEKFAPEFFTTTSTLDWSQHDEIVALYFGNVFPVSICTKEMEAMSWSHYKKATGLTPLAKRGWLEAHDELSRCVKVRAKR